MDWELLWAFAAANGSWPVAFFSEVLCLTCRLEAGGNAVYIGWFTNTYLTAA
jgi:hypothetical protein